MDRWVRSTRPPAGGDPDEEDKVSGLDEADDDLDSEDGVEELTADVLDPSRLNGGEGNGNGNGNGNGAGNGHERSPGLPSTLSLFLNEIGRYRLLTAAEEVELAKRIERGDAAARERMITANLRLVVSIAKRHRIPDSSGLSLLDLIQEGCIGLMRAVELYDWRTGNRFSTYASFWIRQSVIRCLMLKGHIVHVSAGVHARLRSVAKAEQELRARLGREPTEAEVAKLAGLTHEELTRLRLRTVTLSLDQAVDDGASSLGDLIPAESDVVEDVDARMSADALRNAVSKLPSRLQKLIVLRYGMAGEEPHSLAEIGRSFGLTRERVRQLERRALEELAGAVGGKRLDRRRLGRALQQRLSAFDPASLASGLKAALAAGTSSNIASSVAVVAAAGVIAPAAVTFAPPSKPPPVEPVVIRASAEQHGQTAEHAAAGGDRRASVRPAEHDGTTAPLPAAPRVSIPPLRVVGPVFPAPDPSAAPAAPAPAPASAPVSVEPTAGAVAPVAAPPSSASGGLSAPSPVGVSSRNEPPAPGGPPEAAEASTGKAPAPEATPEPESEPTAPAEPPAEDAPTGEAAASGEEAPPAEPTEATPVEQPSEAAAGADAGTLEPQPDPSLPVVPPSAQPGAPGEGLPGGLDGSTIPGDAPTAGDGSASVPEEPGESAPAEAAETESQDAATVPEGVATSAFEGGSAEPVGAAHSCGSSEAPAAES